MLFVVVLGLFAARLHAVLIPDPPGPHLVSYQVHDLTDESRWDPYAPSNKTHKRRLMVSSYLPVDEDEECTPTEIPYMPPQTTVEYGQYAANNGLPNDIFEDIQLGFCQVLSQCSQHTHSKYPLIVFSPGLSSSRLLHNNQARVLASHGFVVVTVDHPYDATFVEFPDGSSISGVVGYTDEESDFATAVRARDLSFVLDLFDGSVSSPTLPAKVVQKADLARIFAYGHSLGGATAAETALLDDRVLGGVDIDGSPWAQSKRVGLDKPLLMVGKGTANGVDETWAPFYKKLTGPKMQLRVEGATHYSYIDIPVLLVSRPLPPEYDDLLKYLVGTVEGTRMGRMITSLLLDFGKLVLEGDVEPLQSANQTYHEIFVVAEDLRNEPDV